MIPQKEHPVKSLQLFFIFFCYPIDFCSFLWYNICIDFIFKKEHMHIINYDNPPPLEELRLSKLSADKENGRYTWEKKYQVAVYFLSTGSMRETSENSGVAVATIESWRKLPWWDNMLEEIKNTDRSKLQNKLSQIINKSLSAIEDRLENGEMVLNNKTGELVRKPVSLRDAQTAATNLLGKQLALEKNIEETVVKQKTIQETLTMLAGEFAKWNNKKIKASATDIQYKELDGQLPEPSDSFESPDSVGPGNSD
jgi:hypothetical protein